MLEFVWDELGVLSHN